MSKCKECRHLDLSQRTKGGYCVCTNTNRRMNSVYKGCKPCSQLKAPSAIACKSGFEPRNEGEANE